MKLPAIGKPPEMKTPLKDREVKPLEQLQSSNAKNKVLHSSSSDSLSPAKEMTLSPVDRELNEADLRMEIGLENLGNTCFMNATLQCLLHVPPLVSYFLTGDIRADISHRSSKKGVIAVSFANLVREVYGAGSGSAVAPVQFKRAVSKYAPYLLDHQQQDCQEFLRFLLDGMSEDLCRREPPAAVVSTTSADGGVVGRLRTALANSLSISTDRDDGVDLGEEEVQRISPDKDKQQRVAAAEEEEAAQSKLRGRKVVSAIKRADAAEGAVVAQLPAIKSAAKIQSNAEAEEPNPQSVLTAAKAAWGGYLGANDSIVTDIFSGLLQSTIECLACNHRSLSFDPFIDLSLPIPKSLKEQSAGQEPRATPGKKNTFSFRRSTDGSAPKCSLEDCFQTFSNEEILDGDNMFTCERCRAKRKCSKRLSVFKYPKVLILQIKRFRFTADAREKLNTDVAFPLSSLDITPYLSSDRPAPGQPRYDLVGASHHTGSLSGGHYTAQVNTAPSGGGRWMCFNDGIVSPSAGVEGPSAYVLFYALQGEDSLALEP